MDERHFSPWMRPGGPRPGLMRPEHFDQAGTDPILWAVFGLVITTLALLVFALVVAFARRPSWRHGPPMHFGPIDPLEFARMRYARGKMSREQYLQLSADLGAPSPEPEPPPPRRRR